MSDIQVSITSNGKLAALVNVVSHAPFFVDGIVRQAVINDISPAILPEAQAEPGPVAKPIEWASEKQRRYVMLMIRRGLIPAPYIRTHALSQAWAFGVKTESNSTTITLANSASKFPFVEGENQQPMHRNTGWLRASERVPVWGNTVVGMVVVALQSAWGVLFQGR